MSHNFRTALGGFHKEDVVRYLEYSNSKHQSQVNQLNSEIAELRSFLEQATASAEDTGRCQALEEENQALHARNEELEARCAELEAQLTASLEKQASPDAREAQEARELEAYRQAERIQKEAQDRAELLYFQANHILTETTARVDSAAGNLTELTDQVMRQITQLQMAASASKQTLQEAAAVLATIRPNR